MSAAHEELGKAFRHFADQARPQSSLYGELSFRVADEPGVLALASGGQTRQPPPNLLFGAVQFLLLSGVDHPLAEFYPLLGGTKPAAEAWPAFADFCARFSGEIVEQVRKRRVQTNEVGRCAVLLPALAMASSAMERPLDLIEVGASAGLNLLFDQYRYEYSNGHALGPDSPVLLRTELRGPRAGALPMPNVMPPVSQRFGVDIEPVDIRDEDAVRWMEALIWPNELSRFERFRGAVALARRSPPRVIAGDGLEVVAGLVRGLEPDAAPCVMHSHAIYQMDSTWREGFARMLDALGRRRDLAHISLEWLGDNPGPQLHLTTWQDGARRAQYIGNTHHHGAWLEPVLAITE